MGTGLLKSIVDNLQFVLICCVVIAAIIGVSWGAEATVLKKNIAQVSRTRYMTICAMLGAVAAVLFLFEFPLPFLAPSFYEVDFSEVPVMIGAFCLGPVGGVVIELVKVLLKLVIKGTSTAFVGDLANFVVGCAFVVPASVVYHIQKTKKTAMLGLLTGAAVMIVFGSAFNAIYLLPAFSELYGLPLDSIVAMGTAINPAIDSVTMLVICAVAPLNLVKSILISVSTMVLYKRISRILHTAGEETRVSGRASQPQN